MDLSFIEPIPVEEEDAGLLRLEATAEEMDALFGASLPAPSRQPIYQYELEEAETETEPEGPLNVKLNEDAYYTLHDSLVQHTVYTPLREGWQPRADASRVVCLNLTRDHFEEGAAKWSDLRQGERDLFYSICNAMSFITGKKEKIRSPFDPLQPKKTAAPRRKPTKKASTPADDSSESATAETGEPELTAAERFIQGGDKLAVYVETLLEEVETDCEEQPGYSPCKVTGYRLWIFDSSTVGKDNKSDLLSCGLHESILEARETRFLVERELQMRTLQSRRDQQRANASAQAPRNFQAAPEFNGVRYDNDTTHFNALVKQYFLNDSNLYVTHRNESDPAANTALFQRNVLRRGLFKDSRDFLRLDLLRSPAASQDFSEQGHPCNLAHLFNKEAAMLYHTRSANVTHDQMHLGAYFSGADSLQFWEAEDLPQDEKELAEEARRVLDQLDTSMKRRVEDNARFLGFPHPRTTYALHGSFLSREFMSKIPLPSRIGSFLYTRRDRDQVMQKLDSYATELAKPSQGGEDGEDIEVESPVSSPQSFYDGQMLAAGDARLYAEKPERDVLGLGDTEYDVTPNTLRHYRHHAETSGFCEYMQKRTDTFVPRPLIAKFINSVRNEVLSRLTTLKLSCNSALVKSPTLSRVVPVLTADQIERAGQRHVLSDDQENFGEQRAEPLSLTSGYRSETIALPVHNQTKDAQLARKLAEYRQAIYVLVRGEEPPADEMDESAKETARKMRAYLLMEADPNNYRETIEKYRPFGNSMQVLQDEMRAKCTLEECFLRKDIFLRLNELNRVAYAKLDSLFYNAEGVVPNDRLDAYLAAKRELMEALAVECWHEFFNNENVSRPCLAIRKHLIHYEKPQELANTKYTRRRIGKRMPLQTMKKAVRPYAEFRLYLQAFLVAQGDLTHNFKIIQNLYFGKSQHCRWFFRCNNPKVNFGMEGNGMSGKSHATHLIIDTMAPGVADNVTYITPKAFCTETNMNDLFITYEEMEMKYLGVGETDSDTTNFFKARLTNGETSVMAWHKDPETGRTSCLQTRNHCQGSMMFASNLDFSKVSPNVLSRVVLMSVPQTKHDAPGIRTQDKYKPQYALSEPATREMFDQHQELHSTLFLVEMMVKSNVFGEYMDGVNMDGARIIANAVLDRLAYYGVNTNNPRKRNHVMEMIRSRALNHAVYIGRTSLLTAYTLYNPVTTLYHGFSPRNILDGILPFMCATKDHIIDGLASMYFQYVHEHEDKILDAFIRRSRVCENLRDDAFLKRYSSGVDPSIEQADNLGRSARIVNCRAPQSGGAYETDYNYIVMTGRTYRDIETRISNALEEFVVSANDIAKLLRDLAKVPEDIGAYTLERPLPSFNQPGGGDDDDGFDEYGEPTQQRRRPVSAAGKRRIVINPDQEVDSRMVVEYTRCAATGKFAIALSLKFLKKKMPHILTDDLVADEERSLDQALSALSLGNRQQSQEEEDQEEETREEKIRSMGYMKDGGDRLIYRAIEDVLQNDVLENMVPESLRQAYMDRELGTVPWESFITPDHPRTRRMEELSPELAQRSRQERGKKAPDVLFVDKLMMLNLKRKRDAPPLVIDNYNTVSPATRSSLSIYESDERGYSSLNRRTRQYNESMAFVLDKDIDYVSCRAHLLNIAFQGLETVPQYGLINYPPTLYMATLEFEEKWGGEKELEEYPYCDLVSKVEETEMRLRNRLDNNTRDYLRHSDFMMANFEVAPSRMREENLLIGCERKRSQALVEMGQPVRQKKRQRV